MEAPSALIMLACFVLSERELGGCMDVPSLLAGALHPPELHLSIPMSVAGVHARIDALMAIVFNGVSLHNVSSFFTTKSLWGLSGFWIHAF